MRTVMRTNSSRRSAPLDLSSFLIGWDKIFFIQPRENSNIMYNILIVDFYTSKFYKNILIKNIIIYKKIIDYHN